MKIAIAGSSGLIGTALSASLRERGHSVIRFVRKSSLAPDEVFFNPQGKTLDRSKESALHGLDAIVNLCGVGIGDKRWSPSRKAEVLSSRVDATSFLASLLPTLGEQAPAFLSASAIGFYGDRGNEELTENSPRGQGFLADVCVAWEAAAANDSSRTVLLRTGVVLDPNGGALKKQLPLFRAGLGGKLGNGRQWLSWIALDDQVAAMVHLIESSSLEGPVNLTSPQPLTNAQFTKSLGGALHRPTLLSVPEFALHLALGREFADEIVFASQRVLPSTLERSGFSFGQPTLEEALHASLR